MRIIIPGGTGLIGRALAKELVHDGHEVILLSRSPNAAREPLPPGVRVEGWNGYSSAGWGHLADGAGAIVNLAGENLAGGPWTNDRRQRILDSRLHSGQAIVEAVQAAGQKPAVLIQSSAVGYYGPRADEQITEDSPPGDDFLAQVCLEWEKSTLPVEAMGVRRAVIRTGVVLSLEDGALPRLILPFRMLAGGPLGNGRQWFPWIHWLDEVLAIRFLIGHQNAAGPFNLTAPNPVQNREFARLLGRVMNRPAFLPAPALAIKLVLGQMATVVLDGQRVLPTRLQALGFQFRFPDLEPALRHILNK